MIVVSHPVSQPLTDSLEQSFLLGPLLDDQGYRFLGEEEVGRLNKMSIQIQSAEHPPPHFHVMFAGENASFAIEDGRRLPNIKGLERFDRNIRKWWKEHRCELIRDWNRLRPADCSVGTIPIPPACAAQPVPEV